MVFITARVHPGETPAQFICQVSSAGCARGRPRGRTAAGAGVQGIMDLLVSDSREAEELRAAYVFKVRRGRQRGVPLAAAQRAAQIVPMLNPDGVFLGNYRTSYLGDDLNRCPAAVAGTVNHCTRIDAVRRVQVLDAAVVVGAQGNRRHEGRSHALL